MTAVEDLTELATRAVQAESVARSVRWHDRGAVAKTAGTLSARLADERAALDRPGFTAVSASPGWAEQVRTVADFALVTGLTGSPAAPSVGTTATGTDNLEHDDLLAIAVQAEADAAAAVTAARISLTTAHLAVLQARLAAIDAGDDEATAAAVRGYAVLARGNPVVRHSHALGTGIKDELRQIVFGRPRSVAVRLGISLAFGLSYLAFLRIFQWDTTREQLPYLALLALSGVIGSVVCTNSLSFDAARVRAALAGGTRLWHVLIVKNIAMLIIVGAAGIGMSVLLAWRAGDAAALLKACGQLLTMIFLWLGVGNVLSVVSPLRAEPLSARFKDGTWKPFLISFATSYIVGLLVNLMLYWRVWAKQSLIEQLGGPTVPVLLLVASATVSWLLLTILAVLLADQPRLRRVLLREMVVYRKDPAPEVDQPAEHPIGRGSTA